MTSLSASGMWKNIRAVRYFVILLIDGARLRRCNGSPIRLQATHYTSAQDVVWCYFISRRNREYVIWVSVPYDTTVTHSHICVLQTPFKETFSKLVFEEISVEAIAHDPVNRKLVVTSHGGDIHMWDLTKISELWPSSCILEAYSDYDGQTRWMEASVENQDERAINSKGCIFPRSLSDCSCIQTWDWGSVSLNTKLMSVMCSIHC